jgi:hypothetical protein
MILEGDGALIPTIPLKIYFLWETRFRDALQKLRRTVAQLSSYKFLQPFRTLEVDNHFYAPCTLFYHHDEQI